MTVELIAEGPAARGAWQEALARDPYAVTSQTPAWMDCVVSSGRYADATRAYQTADAQLLVLPMARRRRGGMPTVLSSMPFGWGTGGLLGTRGYLLADDVAAVIADLAELRALAVSVRPHAVIADVWRQGVPAGVATTGYMSQTVDLTGGFDEVWRHRFAATVRSHCRKAERRGVTVEHGDGGELMDVFDRLYRASVDRWASQQHEPVWLARWRAQLRDPPAKFQEVGRRLGPACRTWVAWRGGAPIVVMLVLSHGRHSTMWRAASDREAARGTGASELVHQLAIEHACATGKRYFHLGDSAPASPLAANKRKFGGIESHYAAYRFERLPLTATDRFLRRQVKRAIGFRD